jgi:hypothetical protein
VPDAAEALIHLGRVSEAEPMVAMLERNGRRLDRPWTSAVGARCRGMMLAAGGDVDGANRAVQQALTEHDRLPMPSERARTQLLAGQLLRRQRQKDQAATTLRGALQTFEDLNTRLWADRARAELARADVGTRRMSNLSPSEQRVAELAASGMPTAMSPPRCSSARRPSSRIWPASTGNWASIRAPNSEGTWAGPVTEPAVKGCAHSRR